jgi:Mlc titration factor MtfA (ptsG expression regulator)
MATSAAVGVLTLTAEDYRGIDEAVVYMAESIAREKLEPDPGCPNYADEITDEAFEKAALALAEPLARTVARIHAN